MVFLNGESWKVFQSGENRKKARPTATMFGGQEEVEEDRP